ncbi:MAG TPA: hypothetical protein VGN42_11490 [Pirellulales bacterium]|nr:hypothetical protein [Pirellulales bacterium]
MSRHSAQIAFVLLACLASTGCGGGLPDPTDSLREFAAAAFNRAAADNRLRAEFDLEPPRVSSKEVDSLLEARTAEVVIGAVDRVIKGKEVENWVIEKRDRVKGGGRGRIKLARDSGDDGQRMFVFVYVFQDGAWTLKDQKCQGRGYLPDELKRYFELARPTAAAGN